MGLEGREMLYINIRAAGRDAFAANVLGDSWVGTDHDDKGLKRD